MSKPISMTEANALLIGHEEHVELQARRGFSGEIAENSLPFRLKRNTTAISRPVLSSPLFGFSKDPERVDYPASAPLVLKAYECEQYGACTLTYTGPELLQCDRRVLSGLVDLLRNRELETMLVFNIRDFAEAIGWGRHSTSATRVTESLKRLFRGSLSVSHKRGFFMARFLDHVEVVGDSAMVRLHKSMRDFYDAGHTYIPMSEYKVLKDGFATWLHGFLHAHDKEVRFELADLHQASGSTAAPPTFQEMVRDTMPKLEKAGVVAAFSFSRGVLKVAYTEEQRKAMEAAKKAKQ